MKSHLLASVSIALSCFVINSTPAMAQATHQDDPVSRANPADDGVETFMAQVSARIALAASAAKCKSRTQAWFVKFRDMQIDKAIVEVTRLSKDQDKREVAHWVESVTFGAESGVTGNIGTPSPDDNDFIAKGRQELVASMACSMIDYHKEDILFLDSLLEGGPS